MADCSLTAFWRTGPGSALSARVPTFVTPSMFARKAGQEGHVELYVNKDSLSCQFSFITLTRPTAALQELTEASWQPKLNS